MTTYLGKSCSFCLPQVPFVNCRQFMYLVISLLVLRAGYGIWLYQFLIYLFTFPYPYLAPYNTREEGQHRRISANPKIRNVQHTKKRYDTFIHWLIFSPIHKADSGGSWTFSKGFYVLVLVVYFVSWRRCKLYHPNVNNTLQNQRNMGHNAHLNVQLWRLYSDKIL